VNSAPGNKQVKDADVMNFLFQSTKLHPPLQVMTPEASAMSQEAFLNVYYAYASPAEIARNVPERKTVERAFRATYGEVANVGSIDGEVTTTYRRADANNTVVTASAFEGQLRLLTWDKNLSEPLPRGEFYTAGGVQLSRKSVVENIRMVPTGVNGQYNILVANSAPASLTAATPTASWGQAFMYQTGPDGTRMLVPYVLDMNELPLTSSSGFGSHMIKNPERPAFTGAM